MSHQVNFYLHPKDLADLEERLRQLGPLDVLHGRASEGRPRVLSSLDTTEDGKPWLFLFLARPEDLSKIDLQHVPAQHYWAVDVIRSPVVEFTRSFFDGQILRRGRAYYVDGFYNESQAWVDKDPAFRAWAKSVLAMIKKALVRRGSDYIGREAATWLESSGGRLVQ